VFPPKDRYIRHSSFSTGEWFAQARRKRCVGGDPKGLRLHLWTLDFRNYFSLVFCPGAMCANAQTPQQKPFTLVHPT